MTLSDLEEIPREYLLAAEVAEFLDSNPNTIRWQAQHEPDKLGFPVIVTGKLVKIPKAGFLHYCRFGRTCIVTETRPETMEYHINQAMQTLLAKALQSEDLTRLLHK